MVGQRKHKISMLFKPYYYNLLSHKKNHFLMKFPSSADPHFAKNAMDTAYNLIPSLIPS